MKILDEKMPIFEMAKLTKKRANSSICGNIGEFIYFSPILAGHSPRIKFYGGSAETDTSQTSPSLLFSPNGVGDVEPERWHNKKNCPNAYDDNYISMVAQFADKFLSLLLLVWFKRLMKLICLYIFKAQILGMKCCRILVKSI